MADIPVYENSAETHVTITANGQSVVAYDFLIMRPEQIKVRYKPVGATAWTDLSYPADYMVAGMGQPNGGTVALIGMATSIDDKLYLWRDTPIEREKDWQNEGDYKADLVNAEQDEIYMIMQELERDMGRAVMVAPGDDPPTVGQIEGWTEDAKTAAISAAASAGNAADSADLSEAWAEGDEPGGPGTKSAREWALEVASITLLNNLITSQNRSLIFDIFDRAVTKPEISLLLALDTLIGRLKVSDLWARHDLFYLPCLHEATVSYLNLRDLDAFTLVPNGGVTFSPFKEIRGDGVDGYYSTQFNITSSGVEFQRDNMDVGIWRNEPLPTSGFDVAVLHTSFNVSLNPWTLSEVLSYRAMRSGGSNIGVTPPVAYKNGLGYAALDRYNVDDVAAYRQGVLLDARVDNNSATNLQSNPITVFRNSSASFSPSAIRFLGVGSALTAEQHRDRFRALSQFFNTLDALQW